MDQPKKFRPEPVAITIGPDEKKKDIIIEDISYKKQQELIKRISNIVVNKELLPTASQSLAEGIQVQLIKEKKSPLEAIKTFVDCLSGMYEKLNGDEIMELLKIASDNKINDKDIEAMGAAEAIGLLTFLLDRQFVALKNLHASLSSMLNQTTTPSQK